MNLNSENPLVPKSLPTSSPEAASRIQENNGHDNLPERKLQSVLWAADLKGHRVQVSVLHE